MSTYTPALPDWKHQSDAKMHMLHRAYYGLFMEMGTGKTKIILDEICQYWTEGIIDTVVIIARKGTYMNWPRNEIPLHIPQSIMDESVIRVWYQGGGNVTQRKSLEELLLTGPWLRILVINTEAFSAGDKAERFTRALLDGAKSTYIVVDESTSIRHQSSKRTKSLLDLSRHESISFRRIMTGMPNPRSPLDLYSQAEFLQRGLLGQSFFSFRARYCVLREQQFNSSESEKQRKVILVDGYRNTDELAERRKRWSYRVLKEDCLDIPPKVYTTTDVDLTDEQSRIYTSLKRNALAMLDDGIVSATMVIQQILRLQQVVCGHVKNDDGELISLPNNRVDATMDVLEEVSGKSIIWSRFRHDVDKIVEAVRERFPGEGIAQFHGGNSSTRHIDSDKFQNDPSCRFMVATYAGGLGNTWTAASTVIYYSNEFDLEKRMQSEDRAHRGGQKKTVTYVDLVSRGTVDEKIITALRKKIDLAAEVMGDGARRWLD